MIELNVTVGGHISDACAEAVATANAKREAVHFVFNGAEVVAQPGESAVDVYDRWNADFEARAKAYREDPQRQVEAAERAAALARREAVVMMECAKTESEMREAKVPWPLTERQMTEYVRSLVEREHDYGTCVYALSMAAEAAFNYVAGRLGVTGFQSSCADLDLIRRTRSLEGPFILLKGEDALYPQYDLTEKLAKWLEEINPWLASEAGKRLAERDASPLVRQHWKTLAQYKGDS
jgi:hypothetical protein